MKSANLLELFSDEHVFSEISHLNKSELARQYRYATPYPHIVLDNLFQDDVLDRVLEEFPSAERFGRVFNNQNEIKFATSHEKQIPLFTRHFLYVLNSQTFLSFVSAISGIGDLIADPYFEGGGLHQIMPGGKLGIHADFNLHSRLKLDRRINVLIYLNKHWKEEYGGAFEMWDKSMQRCEKKVYPLFNRTVIFSTTSETYHGHPEPLTAPAGMSRKSIALYYFTNGRPESEKQPRHSTVFRDMPVEPKL